MPVVRAADDADAWVLWAGGHGRGPSTTEDDLVRCLLADTAEDSGSSESEHQPRPLPRVPDRCAVVKVGCGLFTEGAAECFNLQVPPSVGPLKVLVNVTSITA